MADSASIAFGNAENWGSEDDSRAAKGAAVNRSHSSLSSPFRVIPSPSVLNLQTAHELSLRLGFLSRTLICLQR